VLEGRRYSEGLHQSIEAKEGVGSRRRTRRSPRSPCRTTTGTYDKLAGMTGTAKTEEVEFLEIYKLGVSSRSRPTAADPGRPADLIYKTEAAKFEAVARRSRSATRRASRSWSVPPRSRSPRPVGMLKRRGIPHEVLNAKNHAREAHIVAQAGRKGAVTVSTNMAGRGTDIMLGGNPEEIAKAEVAKLARRRHRGGASAACEAARRLDRREFKAEGDEVKSSAGLYVIGTERHDPAASTTSCGAGPAARATRASRGSTCRCRTT
jgi:preprotein translocase subunit SecA